MKALRWYAKEDIRYEDIPEPSTGPGMVKVKIHYAGICGSDLHEFRRVMSSYLAIPTTEAYYCG